MDLGRKAPSWGLFLILGKGFDASGGGAKNRFGCDFCHKQGWLLVYFINGQYGKLAG